jgi:hypothetical protein
MIFGFESSSEHSFCWFAAATYVPADVPRQPEFLGLTLHWWNGAPLDFGIHELEFF